MNLEDVDLVNAEREAEPERWQSYGLSPRFDREYTRLHSQRPGVEYPDGQAQDQPREEVEEPEERREEVESPGATRPHHDGRHMSTATGTSSVSTVEHEELRGGARQRPSRLDSRLTSISTNVGLEDKLMHYLDRHPTAIKRFQDHRLQHLQTVGSTKLESTDVKLPPFGGKKAYPPPLPEREEYVVEFEGYDDPLHAQNWPMKKKLIISAILILDALAATLASSIFSPTQNAIEQHFHVGSEVAILGTSLFVLGYALGPIIWAPMSEL